MITKWVFAVCERCAPVLNLPRRCSIMWFYSKMWREDRVYNVPYEKSRDLPKIFCAVEGDIMPHQPQA
jgi:hypothetical protein